MARKWIIEQLKVQFVYTGMTERHRSRAIDKSSFAILAELELQCQKKEHLRRKRMKPLDHSLLYLLTNLRETFLIYRQQHLRIKNIGLFQVHSDKQLWQYQAINYFGQHIVESALIPATREDNVLGIHCHSSSVNQEASNFAMNIGHQNWHPRDHIVVFLPKGSVEIAMELPSSNESCNQFIVVENYWKRCWLKRSRL